MTSCCMRSRITARARGAVATLTVAALGAACGGPPAAEAPPAQASARPDTGGIGALGRIEAGAGIVRIASRSLGGQASIVARLFVKEGDLVQTGQVVAELDSKGQLEAASRQAAARIEVARKRLAQAQAGAKPSDVAAQQSDVDRLQRELENARKEHQRYASLGDNVTAAEIDRLQLRVDSATRALTAAQERLASLTAVRGVDVEVARAELNEAVGNLSRARAEHAASVIHSPLNGRVIKVHAWPGEAVGTEGLVEVAPLEPMYAVAEVGESDIPRVKVGQRATVTGAGLKTPLQGTVERLGGKVLQNQVMPVDPANFSDARVVEVWVKLDNPHAVADLIHLRVDVVIQP